MYINELAKQAGVTTHTIRYYENIGLIKGLNDEAVKSNNYKQYDETHLERLEIIKEAQEVGFTLSEIKVLLESWYSGTFSQTHQLEFFEKKILEVELKINQLIQMKQRLEEVKSQIQKGTCE